METPNRVEFNGTVYTLMGRGLYYLGHPNGRSAKPKGLHVAVYEFYTEREVPAGCDVHHKDGNVYNNSFENLECLPASEHRRLPKGPKEGVALSRHRLRQSQHLEIIRDAASQWHRSAEGREWHKRQAQNRIRREFDCRCSACNVAFRSDHSDALFCSRKCWRKQHIASGKRNVETDCVICGNRFAAVQEYEGGSIAKTCGRSCRMKLSHRNRKQTPV